MPASPLHSCACALLVFTLSGFQIGASIFQTPKQLQEGKWTKKWNAFVDDNPITTKIEDMKIEWEESDNMIARRSREVAESFSDAVGGTFEDTEMGYVYEEVTPTPCVGGSFSFAQSSCATFCLPDIPTGFLRVAGRYELMWTPVLDPYWALRSSNVTQNSRR